MDIIGDIQVAKLTDFSVLALTALSAATDIQSLFKNNLFGFYAVKVNSAGLGYRNPSHSQKNWPFTSY